MIDTGKLPNKVVNEGDWRMSIYAEPWRDSVVIYVGHYANGKAYNVTIENGLMKETEVREGVAIDDAFLRLPLRIYDTFATLFNKAEEPIAQEAMGSELKATKYHLEDLRKLVFKDEDTSEKH